LQLARNEAVRRNAAVEFVLDPVGSGWQVRCKAVTPACPNTDPIQQRASAEGSASDITITPAGGLTAEFSGLGMLTLPGGGVSLDIDGPIASESRELRVTVGAGGNVRLCDPQTTAPDPRAC